ncbi:MAG: AAA family ATPase, partial [Proteobacteria bacterium]|nr:AAA family ATPase [Pseudomonadota bacterium]
MKRITLSLPAPYVGLRPFDEKDALLFFGREAHVRDLLAKLEHQQRFISVIGASGSGKSSLVRAGLIPALHRGALASAGHCWKVHITKPGDAPLQHLVEKLTEDQRWIDGGDRAASMASLRAQFAINPLALAEQYQRRAGSFKGEALLLVVDQFEEIFRYRQQNIDEAEAFIKLLLRSVSESERVPVYVVITMRSDFLGHCVAFFGLPEAINSGLYLTPRLRPEQLKSIITSPLALIGSDIDPVLVNRLMNTLDGEDELPVLEHALLRMWNHARKNGRNRIEEQDFAIICKPREGENDATSPKLAFAIGNHASEIYDQLTLLQQQIAQQIFPALVERSENRDMRRPQTFQQLTGLVGQRNQDSLITVIDAFRQDGAGFLLPSAAEKIGKETLIDISHESFFRQWHLYKQWLDDEALDAAELKEWHFRWERHQQTGNGWLDDNDCHRASQWLERINKYHVPQQWATRYLGQHDFQAIKTFIQTSQQKVTEKQQAETKRLENEAALQRQLAENAEKQKQQAEAFARSSRKKSMWAVGAAMVAILLAVISFEMWQHAEQERNRADWEKKGAQKARKHAEKLARDAHADALIATAENLVNNNPDQSILLGLIARNISNTAKVEAHLRYALNHLRYARNLRGHESLVNNAQFAPDGKTIVTASQDNTARLWDAASGKELAVLRGHESLVNNAQFAPDGKTIVTASADKTARLWDAASGKELAVLRGHENSIRNAQFSPDGQSIVTASYDKTARLWDAVSGKELAVLRGHESLVNNAQFAPDGKTIVTASADKTARLWDA